MRLARVFRQRALQSLLLPHLSRRSRKLRCRLLPRRSRKPLCRVLPRRSPSRRRRCQSLLRRRLLLRRNCIKELRRLQRSCRSSPLPEEEVHLRRHRHRHRRRSHRPLLRRISGLRSLRHRRRQQLQVVLGRATRMPCLLCLLLWRRDSPLALVMLSRRLKNVPRMFNGNPMLNIRSCLMILRNVRSS